MASDPQRETLPNAREVIRLAARAFERDRYLAALLGPRAVRDDLIVLAAFAGEIARVPASVSEPMLGEIRLQWWRDALRLDAGVRDAGMSRDASAATGHPIADAMAEMIARRGLEIATVARVIDETAALLVDRPHRDDAALTATIAGTHGSLFMLATAVSAGCALDDATRTLVFDAADAYGRARVIIEAPVVAGEGRQLLPAGDRDETAARAAQSLARVRAGWRGLSRNVQAALLPVAMVGPYLRLSRGSEGVHVGQDVLPLTRVWQLWRAHVLRSF